MFTLQEEEIDINEVKFFLIEDLWSLFDEDLQFGFQGFIEDELTIVHVVCDIKLTCEISIVNINVYYTGRM